MWELLQAPDAIEPYLRDESSYTGHADGVIRVETAEQVAEVLRVASERRVPVTFSARRTSLTGAAVPEGGWVLAIPDGSDPAMVEVDTARRRATAPASVLVAHLEAAVEARGLFFPPDPTSRKECSIGGSVACNASGARSYAHGPVGAWVTGLVVVLADGQILALRRGEHPPRDGFFEWRGLDGELRRVPAPPPRRTDLKNSLGYALFEPPDLIDLFIGSEGTLGYIHQVEVALIDKRPVFAALTFWDEHDAAIRFVERLQRDPPPGLSPMSVEYFDRRALDLAGARHPRFGVPASAAAALFVEQRHAPGEEDEVAGAWYEALLEAGAPDDEQCLRIPRTAADLDHFRDFRHAVPESINALARQRGLKKLGTDLSYPRGTLAEVMRFNQEALADVPAAIGPEAAAAHFARWGAPPPRTLDAATFGHIGDTHLHLNLLPRDAAEADAGRALYAALARHCAQAGGALSGEHGIGKSKRALLAELLPPETLLQMRAIKDALDPHGILAPGNLLAPT